MSSDTRPWVGGSIHPPDPQNRFEAIAAARYQEGNIRFGSNPAARPRMLGRARSPLICHKWKAGR